MEAGGEGEVEGRRRWGGRELKGERGRRRGAGEGGRAQRGGGEGSERVRVRSCGRVFSQSVSQGFYVK